MEIQSIFFFTYEEPKHQSGEHNQAVFSSLIWVFCMCWLSPTWYKVGCSQPVSEIQFSSVVQSWLTLCDPMDSSTPDFPVHHQLPELTQTHVLQVGDAIQPSHPLSSPSPPGAYPTT